MLDLLTRLVDKNLVAVGEGVGGVPRYRLLETMRVYALDRARAAGELQGLRGTHARWWTRWLADHFADLHRDTVLDLVEEFHDDLKSALDWSADDSELGLSLLALLVRPWSLLGRDADALPAIDRLLTEENAERFGLLCVAAITEASWTVFGLRGLDEGDELLERAERWAIAVGDEFQLTFVRWQNNGLHLSEQLLALARARGDRYVAALAVIVNGRGLVDDDPQHARAVLERRLEDRPRRGLHLSSPTSSGTTRHDRRGILVSSTGASSSVRRCSMPDPPKSSWTPSGWSGRSGC